MKASPSPSPSSSSTTTTPPLPDALRRLAAAAASEPPRPSSAAPAARPSKSRKLSSASSAPLPLTLPRPLSADGEIPAALRHLHIADPQLSAAISSLPPPSFLPPLPPFHSLARSILYQQLAFKAATSIYSRFLSLCGGDRLVLPSVVLSLSPQQLRHIGVSDRKATYLYDLAHKYATGILSDSSVLAMDDRSLFTMLTMVKGIGAWSVHMFMIFSLHRPDVLPVGDLGVRKGVQMLYGLDALPRPSQMERLCERWRPYRSVGSWYMWRLVEAKGTPNANAAAAPAFLPSIPTEVLPLPPPPIGEEQAPQVVMQQVQQPEVDEEVVIQHQQQELISPMQGFQSLGSWSWRGL